MRGHIVIQLNYFLALVLSFLISKMGIKAAFAKST